MTQPGGPSGVWVVQEILDPPVVLVGPSGRRCCAWPDELQAELVRGPDGQVADRVEAAIANLGSDHEPSADWQAKVMLRAELEDRAAWAMGSARATLAAEFKDKLSISCDSVATLAGALLQASISAEMLEAQRGVLAVQQQILASVAPAPAQPGVPTPELSADDVAVLRAIRSDVEQYGLADLSSEHSSADEVMRGRGLALLDRLLGAAP